MVISNINVYGLENAVRGSKFPMSADIGDAEEEVLNLKYWSQYGNFIFDFLKYQNEWGRNKGKNTQNSCIFCGSNKNIEKYTKYDEKYYCSKCRHQLDRYGETFEISPKYTILDDYVEMTVYGDKRNEKSVKISFQSLPNIFYQDWHTNGDKYIKNNNGEFLHNFLLKDTIPDGYVVDHINRDIFDNRLENLRICTVQNNSRNCNLSKNNISGIIGVSWSKSKNKWRANINNNGKQIHLGYYNEFDDAVHARLIAEKSLFKEFSPQRHLFIKYNIADDIKSEFDSESNNSFKYNLQQAMQSFKRAKNLGNTRTGEGHDNFINGIIVQFDLTFTVKAWTEAERYHFLDFISSQSTMHRINKFDLDNAYIEYVDYRIIQIMKEKVKRYNRLVAMKPEANIPEYDQEIRDAYLEILYSNPCGFKLTAAMTTNYRQLKTIYHQRKNHRLPEWREFCEQIEQLPYFKELVLGEEG